MIATAPRVTSAGEVDPDLVVAADQLLRKFLGRFPDGPRVEVEISEAPPTHVGFGSKTTTLLSVLLATSQLRGGKHTRSELLLASGRGGTSGIGVHSFFEGGLVVDGGKPTDTADFGPSSASADDRIPPALARIPMPVYWQVALLQVEGVRQSGEMELEFFRDNTPIDHGEALESTALGAFSIPAAAAEADLAGFASSLKRLQTTGFKSREIAAQNPVVLKTLRELWNHGSIGAGMSSMGPTVFAIYEAGDHSAIRLIERTSRAIGAHLMMTSFRNQGYEIRE